MLEILKSIKTIIERFIVNKTPLGGPVSAGATDIPIVSTRRYCIGDPVVIWNQASPSDQPDGEVHVIANIPDNRTITIDQPLIDGYTESNSYVEKMIGYQFLNGVYIGEPAVIQSYPAITVNARSRSSDWLTLESTEEQFTIDITVYVLAADYEKQYEIMHAYVKAIENSLFRSFYPLVEPFRTAILTEDVAADGVIIKIDDPSFFSCGMGWIFLESFDYLKENGIRGNLGNEAFQLNHAAGAAFSAGDKIVSPGRHIFKTIPGLTEYGVVNKGTMLKAAKIVFQCSEEVLRRVPYVDPLTF